MGQIAGQGTTSLRWFRFLRMRCSAFCCHCQSEVRPDPPLPSRGSQLRSGQGAGPLARGQSPSTATPTPTRAWKRAQRLLPQDREFTICHHTAQHEPDPRLPRCQQGGDWIDCATARPTRLHALKGEYASLGLPIHDFRASPAAIGNRPVRRPEHRLPHRLQPHPYPRGLASR